jgi:hypothetical protein
MDFLRRLRIKKHRPACKLAVTLLLGRLLQRAGRHFTLR